LVVYSERRRFGPLFDLVFYVCILGGIGVAVFLALRGSSTRAVTAGVLTVILVLVYVNVHHLKVEITEDRVTVGFGVLKKRIRREDIRSCEPYEITFENYRGYGIRRGADGTVGYCTGEGSGVKIVADGEDKPVVIEVKDPGEVCLILSGRTCGKPRK